MDVEKTMQFILEQQGDFAAHIGALREQQANSAQQIEALSQTVQGLVEVARLDHERLNSLVEVARSDRERLNSLVEVARSDRERLNSLVEVARLRAAGRPPPATGSAGEIPKAIRSIPGALRRFPARAGWGRKVGKTRVRRPEARIKKHNDRSLLVAYPCRLLLAPCCLAQCGESCDALSCIQLLAES